jgi:hydrogenase maturation factor
VTDGCDSDHCVTCADEAVPMRVEFVRPDGIALCAGVEVLTDLVGVVEPGDVLLVHAGVALQLAEGREGVRP